MNRATLGWCILGTCFVLAGCRASVTPVAVPGEPNALRISCTATAADACEYEAKQQCPNGYRVLDSQPDKLWIVCGASSAVAPAPATGDQGGVPSGTAPGAPTMTAPSSSGIATSPASPDGTEDLGMMYAFSIGGSYGETEAPLVPMGMPYEPTGDLESTGWGFTGSALVAKGLTPWLAVGGLASYQMMNNMKVSHWETENIVHTGFVGPDLEALFCSLNCIRLGAAVGVSALSAPEAGDLQRTIQRFGLGNYRPAIPKDDNSLWFGAGYDLHVAYELKVAPKWYLGLGFRVLGAGVGSDNSFVGYSLLADMLHY